jgi:hypothetical protein
VALQLAQVGGVAEDLCDNPGADTTIRCDLTEASTDMTVNHPFVKPTKPREPVMSLCRNARRNHLRVS